MREKEVRGLTLELVKLSMPIVLANLAYTLLGAVDTIFMGQVSTVALGAAGLGSATFVTGSVLLRGIVGGTTPFVSRMRGAEQYHDAGRYMKYFLIMALGISPAIILFPWIVRLYFGAVKPDPLVVTQALRYLDIRVLELPFVLVTSVVAGFLIGIGDSRLPMVLAWFAVLVNIAANYVLVFGKLGFPALGLVGAAWGTVVAVVVQMVLTVIAVYVKYGKEYALTKMEYPSWQDVKDMLRIGVPMGLADGIEVSAFTTFFALISRLGTNELAASQVANQIAALAFMPGFALSAATGSLVGRYLGSDDTDLATRAGYRGTFLGMGLMGLVGICFAAIPQVLVRIFSPEPGVIAVGVVLLRMMAFYQVFDAMNIIFRGALNGAGDTRFTLMVTLLGAWCIMIPGTYLAAFVFEWGMAGAWTAVVVYIVVLGVVFGLRFKSGKWNDIRLVRRERVKP